jgi:hypothetical protein
VATLELVLEQRQLVTSMRRIEQEWGAWVSAARAEQPHQYRGTPDHRDVGRARASRLANSRYAPGTPAGN